MAEVLPEQIPFELSEDEVVSFFLGAIIITAGMVAFTRDYRLTNILTFALASFIVLGIREIAHRIVAYFMTAYVDLEFTSTGAALSIAAAIAAVVLDMPLVFLIPIYSEFRNTQYESWGYEIDVVWSKREYWFAASGIFSLWITGAAAYFMGYQSLSLTAAVFAFYQMLPFRENGIVDGSLDGAYILLQSGFIWLLFFGASIVGIGLSL